MIQLREYQCSAISRLRALLVAGKRRLILQAATGAGKRIMACHVMQSAASKGNRCLFLVHARELVNQCSDELWAWGVPHGVIMAGEDMVEMASIQVASRDTLLARAVRRTAMALPEAKLVVVDECHHCMSDGYQKILASYPDAVVLGLTATPARNDGRGLGNFYEAMVETVPTTELIRQGYLVPAKVFGPSVPDLAGVRSIHGDYHQRELEHAMNKPRLVGDVVTHWLELARDRITVVFASGIAHSLHLREEFIRAGVRTEHIDQDTSTVDRKNIIEGLRSGLVRVVCNVGVFTEGWDCPPVSCCVIARPTKSEVLYRQMVGRVLRSYPGKKDCLVIDHSGCVLNHGFPDEDVEWELEHGEKIEEKRRKRRQDGAESPPITCPACHAMFKPRPSCPQCGYTFKRQPRPMEFRNGKLRPIDRVHRHKDESREAKQRFWNYCLAAAANQNRKAGAAAHMYRQQFGEWPPTWLDRLPRGSQWQQKVAELFPGFFRKARRDAEPLSVES